MPPHKTAFVVRYCPYPALDSRTFCRHKRRAVTVPYRPRKGWDEVSIVAHAMTSSPGYATTDEIVTQLETTHLASRVDDDDKSVCIALNAALHENERQSQENLTKRNVRMFWHISFSTLVVDLALKMARNLKKT